jgi:hypothetical protein
MRKLINIVYPEKRTVTEDTLRRWYVDAVLNGECPDPDWYQLPVPEDDSPAYEALLERLHAVDLWEIVSTLDEAGVITLAKNWDDVGFTDPTI